MGVYSLRCGAGIFLLNIFGAMGVDLISFNYSYKRPTNGPNPCSLRHDANLNRNHCCKVKKKK